MRARKQSPLLQILKVRATFQKRQLLRNGLFLRKAQHFDQRQSLPLDLEIHVLRLPGFDRWVLNVSAYAMLSVLFQEE